MKAHPTLLAFALVLGAGSSAWAQSAEHESSSGDAAATDAPAPAASAYPSYANERHLMVRALVGGGLRFNDVYAQGALTPVFVLLDASYLMVNSGHLHMGPSIGGQLGLDTSGTGTQGAVVPGWALLFRPTPAVALTARAGIPVLFTHGVTGFDLLPYMDQPPVPAPLHHSIDVGFGVELGVGGALYLTSGFAVTAEVSGGMYFGDAFITYPYAAAGLGVLVDYELLP